MNLRLLYICAATVTVVSVAFAPCTWADDVSPAEATTAKVAQAPTAEGKAVTCGESAYNTVLGNILSKDHSQKIDRTSAYLIGTETPKTNPNEPAPAQKVVVVQLVDGRTQHYSGHLIYDQGKIVGYNVGQKDSPKSATMKDAKICVQGLNTDPVATDVAITNPPPPPPAQ